MADGAAKLECMRDSTGNWLVWDNDRGRPAVFNGKVISGLTELQARSIARILVGIYSTRLDAESVRLSRCQNNH